MANLFTASSASPATNTTFGFRPWRQMEGTQPTMGFETYRIISSDVSIIFTGDPVVTGLAVNAAVGTFSGRYVTGSSQAGTNNSSVSTLGIFVGCKYYNPSVGRTVWSAYWPGNQSAGGPDAEAYVISNPLSLFTVQASTNVLITSSYIGYGITTGSSFQNLGNTISGQSGAYVASQTVTAQGSSLPFVIWDFAGTYSGGAGMPSWDINPAAGALSAFVNGMDPTTAGMVLIVKPNNWVGNFGISSAVGGV